MIPSQITVSASGVGEAGSLASLVTPGNLVYSRKAFVVADRLFDGGAPLS